MSLSHALLPPSVTHPRSGGTARVTAVVCGLVSISAALTLSACGTTTGSTPAAKAAPSTMASMSHLTIDDAWVKTADSGMTAVFGRLRNSSSSPMTVISATTSASARSELHEMAMVGGTMQMRPKKDGFVIPAGATYLLAPGGKHLMVMDLKKPIRPGDVVDVKLTLTDGSSVGFSALGKASSGGKEKYAPGKSPTPSSMPSSVAAK